MMRTAVTALISLATTVKLVPASSASAASIGALRARTFVWSAMSLISYVTALIFRPASDKAATAPSASVEDFRVESHTLRAALACAVILADRCGELLGGGGDLCALARAWVDAAATIWLFSLTARAEGAMWHLQTYALLSDRSKEIYDLWRTR